MLLSCLYYMKVCFDYICFIARQAHGVNYRRGFRPFAKYVHFSTHRRERERERESRCVLVRGEYASAINVMILPANPSIICRERDGTRCLIRRFISQFCAIPLHPDPFCSSSLLASHDNFTEEFTRRWK